MEIESVKRKIRGLEAVAAERSNATPAERETAQRLADGLRRDYGLQSYKGDSEGQQRPAWAPERESVRPPAGVWTTVNTGDCDDFMREFFGTERSHAQKAFTSTDDIWMGIDPATGPDKTFYAKKVEGKFKPIDLQTINDIRKEQGLPPLEDIKDAG